MFSQTWKKYLPVIVILLKRSANEPQTLTMNHTDFSRAAGGRKIKYSFHSLFLNNGRIDNTFKLSPLAREFAEVLQENEQSKRLLQKQNLEFSMSNDFQLTIRNTTPVVDTETFKSAEEINEVSN
jgi:hypothetical protein